MTGQIRARRLVDGPIEGQVLRLDEPISFWGGFDAATGVIIDRSHPQHGACLTGRVVAMPGSRGSSGTPGVLGDSLRRGTGPAALIVTKADINLVAGALAAAALYGTTCPILLVTPADLATLPDSTPVAAGVGSETLRFWPGDESGEPPPATSNRAARPGLDDRSVSVSKG